MGSARDGGIRSHQHTCEQPHLCLWETIEWQQPAQKSFSKKEKKKKGQFLGKK